MTSFAISPLVSASPVSGLVALDFGPAALIVGAVLLMMAAVLAMNPAATSAHVPPPAPRSRAAQRLHRLGRNLRPRPERRRLIGALVDSRF